MDVQAHTLSSVKTYVDLEGKALKYPGYLLEKKTNRGI